MTGPIVLLTDFGLKDPYVGVMKGVIKTINPSAEIIDLTHNVTRQDVYEAAIILMVSARYFPEESIFVCVVDPGVGSSRKALLIKTERYYLIGPDNGCLSLLATMDGIREIYDVTNSKFRLREISYTFHGRDVFAPIAAWLSRGVKPEKLGEPVKTDRIVLFKYNKPILLVNEIVGEVIYIDAFGNIMTNISEDALNKYRIKHGQTIEVAIGSHKIKCPFVPSFSHVGKGEIACYINSWGYFEIGINHGDASRVLNIRKGDKVSVKAQ